MPESDGLFCLQNGYDICHDILVVEHSCTRREMLVVPKNAFRG
jgi:hypothetical protein